MNRWETKLTAGLLIFAIVLLFSLLPMAIWKSVKRRGAQGERIIAALLCFSGGVFFGAYILHITPEAKSQLYKHYLDPEHIDYPLSEVLVGAGFFLVFLVEKLIYMCSKKTAVSDVSVSMDKKVEPISFVNGGYDGTQMAAVEKADLSQVAEEHSPQVQEQSSMRTIMMTIGLSLDSILEGMSLGLQDSTNGTWKLFAGIIAHEAVLSFGLGIQVMSTTGSKKRLGITAAVYSLTGAVGLAIGAGIFETQGESNATSIGLASGILQSIAAGVFLYVAFCEILEGHLGRDQPWWKLGFIFLGFCVMAGISGIPHEHDHDHGHGPHPPCGNDTDPHPPHPHPPHPHPPHPHMLN